MSASNRLAGDRPVPDLVTELPGPKARAHVAYDETWTSPSLPRAYPIVPVRGDGLTLEDIDGNLFLDFAAGIAVNSTGHAHPAVVAAIKEQAGELLHFSASDFYLPIYAETCQRIAEITPVAGGRARAYLGNSGTEVVETAIKLARFATKRPYVVAFLGAFHGRSYGSVSLTASKSKYHAGFGPRLSLRPGDPTFLPALSCVLALLSGGFLLFSVRRYDALHLPHLVLSGSLYLVLVVAVLLSVAFGATAPPATH